MTYTAFNGALPNGSSQTGTQFGQSARDNLNALRDACIMGGGFYGWNMAATGGTAAQPALLTYSSGTERLKAALTWDGNGNVSVAVYSYSSDSGGSYSTIKTKTITYDGSQNVTATTWA